MQNVVYKNTMTIQIPCGDRAYSVSFDKIFIEGPAWTFDPNNDTNMTRRKDTGKMRIFFAPDTDESLPFPEDLKREREYTLTLENAQKLYAAFIPRDEDPPAYWFALDMASYLQNTAD